MGARLGKRWRCRLLLATVGMAITTSCASGSRATESAPTASASADASSTAPAPPAETTSPTGSGPQLTWLYDDGDYAAIECIYRYPDDLAARPIAFDGTVLGIRRYPFSQDAGLTLDVMACGFTRSYSDEDADLWADIFAGP